MTTYLVERYLPGRDRAWLEDALARLPLEQDGVAYLGSMYIPEDESCLCRFEASDAEGVRLVGVDPDEEAALAAGGDGHVAVEEEGQSPEHPLLGERGLVRDERADPRGELLVVRHAA